MADSGTEHLWMRRTISIYIGILLLYIVMKVTVGEHFWLVILFDYITLLLFLPVPFLLIFVRHQLAPWQLLCITPIILMMGWIIAGWLIIPDIDNESVSTMAFTVLTYNVGNGLAPPTELVSLLQESDADIIGLQELTTAQADAIEAALQEDYPYQVLHGQGIPGKGLISRFPITDSRLLYFDVERPDLYVQVTVNNLPLTILVAHPLPPRIQFTGFHFTAVTRQHLLALEEMATSGQATIMMGDFNLTERHHTYHQFIQNGLIDAFREVSSKPGFTLPARIAGVKAIPFIRIDYIWHTPHLRSLASWVGHDAGSDHLPVFARLELP